jgi:hypothetical protein
MLTLRTFHIFFIALSIVLASGFGTWAMFNHDIVLGILSLVVALGLVVYGGYFVRKAQRIHLE